MKVSGAGFNLIAKSGMKLTDLKVDGYQTSTQLNKVKKTCGMQGKITISILTDDGSIAIEENGDARTYEWWESFNWDTKTWNNDGHWEQVQDGVQTPITSENDIEFDEGDGLFVQVGTGYVEGKTVLINQGEALMNAKQIPLADGVKCVIPTLSAGVKLSTIKIDGYQTSKQLNKVKKTCGMQGKITVSILADDGSIVIEESGDARTYEWWESFDWDTKTWNNDGHWEQVQDGVQTPITKDNDVTFAFGEGLFTQVGTGYVEDMTVIEFPGIDE